MSHESNYSTPRSRRARWAAVAAVLAGGGVALAAGQLAVSVPTVEILAGKTGFAKPVATANKGDSLNVVAEEGDWLKVSTAGGQQGYVKKAALSSPALTAGGRPLGSAKTGGVDPGNAAKGLEPAAREYAQQNRLDPAAVQYAIDQRKALEAQPQKFDAFQQQGRIGTSKGQ